MLHALRIAGQRCKGTLPAPVTSGWIHHPFMPEPEEIAREKIDELLTAAGWAVQNYRAYNPSASVSIALCEVPLKTGPCDYLLLIDRRATRLRQSILRKSFTGELK